MSRSLWGACALLVAGLLTSMSEVATAEGSPREGQERTPALIAAAYLEDHPDGILVSPTHVIHPDGSGFVAEGPGTLSLSQCASGRFCTWSSSNYTGSFSYVTGSGVTRSLPGIVKSVWNNRARAALLFNNSGGASTCYAPGGKKALLAVAYQNPAKVVLSSGTGC